MVCEVYWSLRGSSAVIQVVSGGFCMGCPSDYDYRQLNQVLRSHQQPQMHTAQPSPATDAYSAAIPRHRCSLEFVQL